MGAMLLSRMAAALKSIAPMGRSYTGFLVRGRC